MAPHNVFLAALFIFIAVVAPASLVAANALMLDRLALTDVLPLTAAFALGVALALLALFWLRSSYAPASRLALWLIVFLVVGFQFALFVGSEQLDGAPIDWVSYLPYMGIEVAVLLAGGFLFLKLPERGIDLAAKAATVFMLLNLAFVTPSLIDFAQAETESEAKPGISADPFAYVNSSPLARFFGTFPPGLPELNSYSSERNVVVLVIDTLQSDVAEELLKKAPTLAREFDGFASYSNAAALYPYTGLTLPTIHSGEVVHSGGNISDFLDRADAGRVERPLAAAGFGISHLGLWQRETYSYGPEATQQRSADTLVWLAAFRGLPRISKPLVFGTVPNLLTLKSPPKVAIASEEYFRNLASLDLMTMRLLISHMRADAKRPQFKWIHFWGSHMPSTTSINCTSIAEPSFTIDAYRGQSTCMLRMVGKFLGAMRAAGVYDASQIFVIADHGTKAIPVLGDSSDTPVPWKVRSAAHPMLLFKDYRSRGPLQFSDAIVSQLDIKPTILSGIGLPAGDRTLLRQGAPIVREFFDYTLAAEVNAETITLRKYRIPDRIRDAAGWVAVPAAP